MPATVQHRKNNGMTSKMVPGGLIANLLGAWRLWLVIGLLVLAAGARLWKIEYVPYPDDGDELAYVFAGQSLIEYGRPVSWSSFLREPVSWQNISIGEETVSRPAKFTLTNPWFDHSFALPLIVGGWSELAGYTFPSIPPALWYRLPMVGFALATLALAFLISQKWWGYWGGILTLLLLGFAPSFVFIQRMVVPENLLIPAFLAALYAFITNRPWWQVALFALLAGLVKVTGLLIVPILAFAYWYKNEKSTAVAFVSAAVLGTAVLLLIYAASVDLSLFFTALKNQSSRLLGWSNPAFLLASPGFHTHQLLDFGYYIVWVLGLGGVASTFFTEKNDDSSAPNMTRLLLVFAVVGWFFTVWVTSAELDMLGWYKIPLFICLGIAAGAAAKKQMIIPLAFLAAVMLLSNLGLVRYPDKPLPDAQMLRMLVGVLLVLSVLAAAFMKKWMKPAPVALGILAFFVVAQSFWVSDQYFAAMCKDRTCSTPVVTLKSVVKNVLQK